MMSLRAVLEELRTALRAHISNARDKVADFAPNVTAGNRATEYFRIGQFSREATSMSR